MFFFVFLNFSHLRDLRKVINLKYFWQIKNKLLALPRAYAKYNCSFSLERGNSKKKYLNFIMQKFIFRLPIDCIEKFNFMLHKWLFLCYEKFHFLMLQLSLSKLFYCSLPYEIIIDGKCARSWAVKIFNVGNVQCNYHVVILFSFNNNLELSEFC